MRGVRAVPALCGLTVALAGCTLPGNTPERTTVTVGMALEAAGTGDLSYNDSAMAALDRARKNLDVKAVTETARPGETAAARRARLVRLARSSSLVVAMGPEYGPAVDAVAARFPDVRFFVVDPPNCRLNAKNAAGACFRPEQGAYLTGVAAALRSPSGTLGFVGAKGPHTRALQVGFEAGARSVKPGIRLLPPKSVASGEQARSATKTLLTSGADIIFQAARRYGPDVVGAVRGTRATTIGSTNDQYSHPAMARLKDHILTSAVVRVDLVVHEFVRAATANAFKPGTDVHDLDLDHVGYTTTSGRLDTLRSRLDTLKLKIIDRRIHVPRP